MSKISITLEECLQALEYQFKSESELVSAIEELSEKFTINREQIQDYLKDPKLVSAYTIFFFLTNLPKFEGIIPWLPQEFLEKIKSSDLIDLGAGPGTFSFAWKNWGGLGDVYQVETSKLMRDQAKKIWKIKRKDEVYQSDRWCWNPKREKFLIFGHSANEMSLQTALDYISEIDPDHILFIEPGTKDFFSKMLQLRESLIRAKYNILFPCPTSGNCPMQKSSQDWCHQFLKVSHSKEVERLTQLSKKDRRLLPLTVQAYSKSIVRQENLPRIVRVHPETKFSFEWEVCEGTEVVPYQVMKRDIDKESLKKMKEILAGFGVNSKLEKVIGNKKRVKLFKY